MSPETFSASASSAGSAPRRPLLEQSLQYLKGVGPQRALLLKRLGLETIHDLLFYFPSTYKDRTRTTPLKQAARKEHLEECTVHARLVDLRVKRASKGKHKLEGLLEDGDGELRVCWWNPYVADVLRPGEWGCFSGKIARTGRRVELSNPEFVFFGSDEKARPSGPEFGRLVPVYSLRPKLRRADGEEEPEIKLRQRVLRGLIWRAGEGEAPDLLRDELPETLRRRRNLVSLSAAVRGIHFPDSRRDLDAARRRLAYEELLIVAAGAVWQRRRLEEKGGAARLPLTDAVRRRILRRLPFPLTAAQQRAWDRIAADTASGRPMNRLLQGDVGCGKTVVAVAAMLTAVAHKHQAALLAPTEILAEQHFRTLRELLRASRVKLALLHGGMTTAERRELCRALAAGEIHLAVGTHALLEPSVSFKSLALIVIDEQHKFGVEQRRALREKARVPHVLVMTATPIPRTMLLTLYGDLDVSVIDAAPPGRGKIVTRHLKEKDRPRAYRLIRREARAGRAAYVVLPHIEEAGSWAEAPAKGGKRPPQDRLWSEVKGVEAEVKRLREKLPDLHLAALHGRMSREDKERAAAALHNGELDVLVSTQVIEVGVDVPRATVMVIENAERFGLAALHQLRGRIGRGPDDSYCLFFGQAETDAARERLRAFEQISDGFQIAETDFRLRGPGSFYGTAQSGLPEFKAAKLPDDAPLLEQARTDAVALFEADPRLSRPENIPFRQRLLRVLKDRAARIFVG